MLDRLAATCCIGCRRVDAPQLCAGGCDERTVVLVFGAAMDAALAELASASRDIQALRTVLLRAVGAAPDGPPDPSPQAHRALQADARAALRAGAAGLRVDAAAQDRAAADPADLADLADVEHVVAGHCPDCGWIEAPQPCLGVCIFRAVEMVRVADYDAVQARCEDARRQVALLRTVVRQLAWVTPRAGEGERTARALQSHARKALEPWDGSGP